jgi:hypothetical protein
MKLKLIMNISTSKAVITIEINIWKILLLLLTSETLIKPPFGMLYPAS